MKGYVYLMTNNYNSVVYTGVTSDLKERIKQSPTKEGEAIPWCHVEATKQSSGPD